MLEMIHPYREMRPASVLVNVAALMFLWLQR